MNIQGHGAMDTSGRKEGRRYDKRELKITTCEK
jgi:hypothetical protein